ncbi:MAG: response regulator [Bryobacteraceae bacterium]
MDSVANPVNVLLVEDSEDEALLVEAMLSSAGPFRMRWAANLSTGLQQITEGGVDVVLLDLGLPDGKGPDSFHRMSRAARHVPIVVLTGDSSLHTELAVRERGAKDVLVKQQIGTEELVRAILQASRSKGRRGRSTEGGRIIGFVGAKGGVGATSLVLNVAAALAQMKHRAVAVELPDTPSGFALHLGRPFAGLVQRWSDLPPDRLNADALRHHMVRMPFGAEVLFGPQSADACPQPGFGRISGALWAASEGADFVLADIGTSPSGSAWEAISVCDFLVLVADREPTSIHAARRWLQWFRLKGLGGDRIGTVVVNRSGLPTNTSMQQVAREIGCPLVGVIPSAGEHMAHASTRQEILLQWKPDNLSAVSLMDTAVRLSAPRVEPIWH